jgi:DNA-binding response OmpR family regulator
MCNSSNPRILYVDDDRDACEMMGLILQLDDDSYQFSAVTTAQKALVLMKEQPISLFILDSALPEMSGIELCRLIRQIDSQIPIMFYSGMVREIDREAAFKAGANEYLIKPNDLDRFTDTVKQLLTKSPAILKGASSVKTEMYNHIH